MATSQEVFEKVQETLVDALGVDDDEVTPEATLIGDLGAESIDFLDIVFRLEKNFDVKIPRGELFPRTSLLLSPALLKMVWSPRKESLNCAPVCHMRILIPSHRTPRSRTFRNSLRSR